VTTNLDTGDSSALDRQISNPLSERGDHGTTDHGPLLTSQALDVKS
jgi:hypothetical protein